MDQPSPIHHFIYRPAAEKRELRTYANNEDPDCADVQSGRDRCSPTQYRDLVEAIGLIPKILTRRVALCKLVWGFTIPICPKDLFCQLEAHILKWMNRKEAGLRNNEEFHVVLQNYADAFNCLSTVSNSSTEKRLHYKFSYRYDARLFLQEQCLPTRRDLANRMSV